MDLSILQLPIAIQIALGSGYAAYLVAYRGIRAHHKPFDTAALALVFSLAATAMLQWAQDLPLVGMILVVLSGALVVGFLWRLVAIDAYQAAIRKLNLSWADDSPSAWFSLQSNSKFKATQVAVLTDDGSWLRCDDLHKFAGSPFGPCVLGTNGDVALYLTHEDRGEESREMRTVRSDHWGDRLTYIPASRIVRVTVRLKRAERLIVLRRWWLIIASSIRRFRLH